MITGKGIMLLISVIVVFPFANPKAQEIVNYATGAKGAALGQIQAVLFDYSAAYGNQAGLSGIAVPTIQLSYEYRLNNPELKFVSINGILPAVGGVFSFLVRHFGYDLYREQLTGIAYSRRMSSDISMAIQFDLIRSSIRGYGSQISPTFEVGWLVHLSDSWTTGFHCFNPLGQHGSDLPFEAEWGILFHPADYISFYASFEKQTGKGLNQKMGMEYQHDSKLFLRLGFSTQPGLFTFGTGFRVFKDAILDLASVAHLDLGLFSVITLKYDIKRKSP